MAYKVELDNIQLQKYKLLKTKKNIEEESIWTPTDKCLKDIDGKIKEKKK